MAGHVLPDPSTTFRMPKIRIRHNSHADGISLDCDETPTRYTGSLSPPQSEGSQSNSPRPSLIHSPRDSVALSTSSTTPTKPKKGLFGYLVLKEPSLSAWEQYAQEQRVQAALGGVAAAGMSDKRLPSDVPKVSSKWHGMPEKVRQRSSSGFSFKRSTDVRNTTSESSPRRASPGSGHSATTCRTTMLDVKYQATAHGTHTADDFDRYFYGRRDPENSQRTSSEFAARLGPRMSVESTATPQRLTLESARAIPETIPETRPAWPSSYTALQEPQATSSACDRSLVTEPTSHAHISAGSLWSSAAASPSSDMPSTPRGEMHFFLGDKDEPELLTPMIQSRNASLEDHSRWDPAFDPTDLSSRSSISDAAPPPIPMKSSHLQSPARALPKSNESSRAHSESLSHDDDTPPVRHGIKLLDRLFPRSFSQPPPVQPASNKQRFTRVSSGTERSDQASEDSGIPLFSASNTAEDPLSPVPSFSDQSDGNGSSVPPSIALTRRTPGPRPHSFSRPLRNNSSPYVSPELSPALSMGAVSIIPRGSLSAQPPPSPTSSNHTGSLLTPPRFLPGRVVVKDSDLDTIAESDTTSIHGRRHSFSSMGEVTVDRDSIDGASIDGVDISSSVHTYDTDNIPIRRFSSFSSASTSGTPPIVSYNDSPDTSGDETETERDYRGPSSSANTEDDASSLVESEGSEAGSDISESWRRSPRERLGLGGFIRRATQAAPWPLPAESEDEGTGDASPKLGNFDAVRDVARRSRGVFKRS